MKPIFKNSAIAILVALGLSGCLSTGSSGNSTPATTTAISGTGTGSSAGTSTDSGSASTGTSTSSGSTSTGTSTGSGSGSTSNTAYKYSDNIKNKDGEEWRLVDTSIPDKALKDTGVVNNVSYIDYIGYYQASIDVNFNKLSSNQLGKFSGTTEGEFLFGSKSKPSNKLDYTFINQPYSTYGMVTDANGEVETFALIQNAAKSSSIEGANGITLVSDLSEYVVVPKGSATYNGNVFANVQYEDKDSTYKNLAKEDGSFTLTADFDKSTVSGTLNSNTLGEIKLIKSNLDDYFKTNYNEVAYAGDAKGEYQVTFGGKELNDVVGKVSFNRLSDKTIVIDGKDQKIESYKAAFGGTKQ